MRRLQYIPLAPVLFFAIVLLAAGLRFVHLGEAEFLWDQAEIAKWALNMARHGQITWVGPWSSTRLDTFPFAIWLMAIPFTISSSPLFATGFVAALNLVAVIGCYFLTRHWFGRKAALVAMLLFAAAPWAVIYSRRIWHTPLLPILVLVYVVTAWNAFVRGRRWALVAHFLALAALVQTHFSALPFVVLTALWTMIFRRRIDWRVLVASALLAAVTFLPYFVVDAQEDWENVRRFTRLMEENPAKIDDDAAYGTWLTSTGLGLDWLTGPDRYAEFVAGTPNARSLFAAVGALAIIGGVVAMWQAGRQARAGLDDETAAALLAVTWLAMPALFLTRHNTGVAPHYFTTTFPAQFILVGFLVAVVWRWSGKMARVVQGLLVALLVTIAVLQIYETVSVLRFVMTRDTRWGHGTPLEYKMQAVETAKRLAQEIGAEDVILLSEGDEPRMYEMPNVADVLLYDAPHRSVDVRTACILPRSPAVFWATYDMAPGEELLATFVPEAVDERIMLREDARSFRFYRWPGGEPDLPDLLHLPDGPRTWVNGAQLIGYILSGNLQPGGTLRWTLVWRPEGTPSEDINYHWFNHLLDEQGQMRAQRDGPSVLPAHWRAGDMIFNWFDFQIPPDAPPGEYTMHVGMYTYPGVQNVPLRGAADVTTQEWVEVGPLRVGE
jgi:4-amino-4-deoxy-L-arabinose transferase-like glycosyltransferase